MRTRREMLALLIGGLLAPWEGIRRALWPKLPRVHVDFYGKLRFENPATFVKFRNGWSCQFVPSGGGEVQGDKMGPLAVEWVPDDEDWPALGPRQW